MSLSRVKSSRGMARRPGAIRSGRGYTLVETMLAVGIATSAMVGTLSFGSKVWAGAKLGQADAVAEQVNDQVLTRFSITPSFASLPSTPASTWISDLPMSGGNVQGPWGAVQLQAATVNSAADSWALTFNAVPIGDCVQMITSMSSKYYASGANGAFASSAPGKAVDPDQATALCNASSNKVTFVSPPLGSTSAALVAPAFAATAASTLPVWIAPKSAVAVAAGGGSSKTSTGGSSTSGGDPSASSGDTSTAAPVIGVIDTKPYAPPPTTSAAPEPTTGTSTGKTSTGPTTSPAPDPTTSTSTDSAPAPGTASGTPTNGSTGPVSGPPRGLPVTGAPVVDTTGGKNSNTPPKVILNNY